MNKITDEQILAVIKLSEKKEVYYSSVTNYSYSYTSSFCLAEGVPIDLGFYLYKEIFPDCDLQKTIHGNQYHCNKYDLYFYPYDLGGKADENL